MNTKQNMNTLKWDNIPWTLIEKYILQIQNRIYFAEKKNDKKHVYILQNKLLKSWSLQTKIFCELCFMEKNSLCLPLGFIKPKPKGKQLNFNRDNINESKELLQTLFPFFSNNENIKNKISSIFYEEKKREKFVLFCSEKPMLQLQAEAKKSKKKNKLNSIFLKDDSNKTINVDFSVSKYETNFLQIPTTLKINLTNSKAKKFILLNKNFSIMKLLTERQHSQNKRNIGKFSNDPNSSRILPQVSNAKINSLNCFLPKFLNWFIDYQTLITHKADVHLLSQKILLKYYQYQYLQHFCLSSLSLFLLKKGKKLTPFFLPLRLPLAEAKGAKVKEKKEATNSMCLNNSLKNLTFASTLGLCLLFPFPYSFLKGVGKGRGNFLGASAHPKGLESRGQGEKINQRENSIFLISSKKNIPLCFSPWLQPKEPMLQLQAEANKNKKKYEIRSYKVNDGWVREFDEITWEFDIFFKEKIDSYRKSKSLEKKIKSLLQIFYLTKDFSEEPFFSIEKIDIGKTSVKNNKGFRSSKRFQFTYLNEKMSFFEITKIMKLTQIQKKIEPQWQARYESSSYSLKKEPSAFKKIQAIFKTICDQPKFLLKIELKSQDLFLKQINDKKQENLSVSPVNLLASAFSPFGLSQGQKQRENFIYFPLLPEGEANAKRLKNFFFYGLEKAFYHILKKQYPNISNSFFKQILIFEKNQILILHENDVFLKNFCQLFFFIASDLGLSRPFFFPLKGKTSERKKKNEFKNNSSVDFKENIYSIETQIVHSFMPYEKNPPGIDFLGFHINQLNKKQYLQKNIDLEYFKKPGLDITKFNIQTFLAPSLSNVRNHLIQIRTIIKESKTVTQELLIKKLSPKIRGWSKFYSQAFSLLDRKKEYQKTAKYCDYLTFKMLWRWACRRHPKKNRKWIKLKYFKTLTGASWIFCVTKKIESVDKNTSHNSALISSEKNLITYATSFYLCLPLHRDI